MIIELSKQVAKFLNKQSPKQAKQISKKIMDLENNPFPQDSKKLRGKFNRYFRVDIGEFRIIYLINNNKIIVPIVGKRNDSEVYKLLDRKLN